MFSCFFTSSLSSGLWKLTLIGGQPTNHCGDDGSHSDYDDLDDNNDDDDNYYDDDDGYRNHNDEEENDNNDDAC